MVISHGTLAFLCRAGGWRALSYAPVGASQPRQRVRLTHEQLWSELHLCFGDEAIDALIIAFNGVCQAGGQQLPNQKRGKRSKSYPTSRTMAFERNGDLLVHHIVWFKIRQAPFKVHTNYWSYLTRNPLTRIARLDLRSSSAQEVLERLLLPDINPLLPWLSAHLVRCWVRELETRWDSLERFDRLNTGMAELFEQLLHVAQQQERRDLLRPVVAFFREHFAREGLEQVWEQSFNRLARDLRIADRDAYRRTWARAMMAGWRLWEEYTEARSVHPVDREGADRVFMELIEEEPYELLGWRARAFTNQLNAVIS